MNNYDSEQSEDGELSQSPAAPDVMDFSLSDGDGDGDGDASASGSGPEVEPDDEGEGEGDGDGDGDGDADGALVIQPPQPGRSCARSQRRREPQRRRLYQRPGDRDAVDIRSKRDVEINKHGDREVYPSKEYYRDRVYAREKEAYRDKDAYRTRDHFREKDYKEKEAYDRESEVYREKDIYREKDAYRLKDSYREKDHHKEKDYREKEFYREKEMHREKEVHREKDMHRDKETYREKDVHREKDSYSSRDKDIYSSREKDIYVSRERERLSKHVEVDRLKMSRQHGERDRKGPSREDARLRHAEENSRLKDSSSRYNEKENRDKISGDKELEDLRSRLLSKRQSKEQQEVSRKRDERGENSPSRDSSRSSRLPELNRTQLERREKLLKTEREMSHRKKTSRAALAARREKLKEDISKRLSSPSPTLHRKRRRHSRPASPSPPTPLDDVVMVSDASDVDMKSDASHLSNNSERGTASSTESTSGTTEEESESEEEEDEEDIDDDDEDDNDDDINNREIKINIQRDGKDRIVECRIVEPPTPQNMDPSPASIHSITPPHSSYREDVSRSPTRSRSNSFSPPPAEGNGAIAEPVAEVPAQSSPPPTPVDESLDLPPYYPALQGCRSVEEFQCLNRIEEGTYGVVYRAKDKTTDEIVALKRLKMEKEKEGFPITSLREINTLLKGQHPNIVTVREIVVGSNMDKIFIVMDYVEHDLKGLMETMRSRKQVFLPGEVKCLMQQLLRAVDHLHDNWILHRDLKTSNLLLSHKGILKVGDFGLAREYGSPLKSYTPIVVTLWYRAPELLLGTKQYSTPIDVWSVGCIFAEFITMNALFPGKSDVDQLNKIFKELGTPNEFIWPGWSSLSGSRATWAEHPGGGLRKRVGPQLSETGLHLLNGLLTYDPMKRMTANQALNDSYFTEQPLAIDPAMFPTWPAKSEGGRRHQHSPKPPSGGDQYKLLQGEDQATVGFHMGAMAPAMAPFLPPVSSGFSLKF